jgi:hypothetical protein
MGPFETRLARDLRGASSVALIAVDPLVQARAAIETQGGLWRPLRSIFPLLVFAAVATGLALIVGVAVIGGSPQPRLQTPTVPPPAPALVEVASPSPSDSLPACMTDTVRMLTGSAMGPAPIQPPSLAGLGAGKGVFTTTAPDSPVTEIWSVGVAGATPLRIGEIVGGGDVLDVLDLTRAATKALIRIGTISPSGAHPECGDLYLVATDGSGIERLTESRTGTVVVGGALSPDATMVAYATWNDVGVIDLASLSRIHQYGCVTAYQTRPDEVAWSSTGDVFAVDCVLPMVYDPTGYNVPVAVATTDTMIGFGWANRPAGASLLIGESSDGAHQNGFHVDTAEPWNARVTSGVGITDRSIDWVLGSARFSPSGHRLIAEGYVGSDDALYFLDVKGGAPRRFGPNAVRGGTSNIAWSSDERSIVFADVSEYPSVTLVKIDVASGMRTSLGALPADYDAGTWRIP